MAGITRWWTSPPPSVAVEIAAGRVTGVSLGHRGGEPTVLSVATVPLTDDAVVPSLTGDNLVNRGAVVQAVGRVLEAMGKPRRVALVVPDAAAKVSLVRFEQVPSRASDLEQMVRWQVRKSVPFPIDTAQVGFVPAGHDGRAREFLVVVVRRDVVEGYESAVTAAGVHPGLVDLASLNLVNLVLAGDRRAGRSNGDDWLLVHLTRHGSTLLIVRDDHVAFYRSRSSDAQEPLADLVHQTAMYYEDRLGGRGFGRVMLSATQDALASEQGDVRGTLEERLRSRLELVDVSRVVRLGDRVTAGRDELTGMAVPIGALLREAA